jgi:hypothetical protein
MHQETSARVRNDAPEAGVLCEQYERRIKRWQLITVSLLQGVVINNY